MCNAKAAFVIWTAVRMRVAVDHETSGENERRNLSDGGRVVSLAETRSGPAGGGRAASSEWSVVGWLFSGSRDGGEGEELKAKECCGTNVLWPRSLARQVQKFLTILRECS